jgi:adenosine deaminase
MPNILVTTLGTSWQIIPELLAFTNPLELPLLNASRHAAEHDHVRHEYNIDPVDEIWIITTNGTSGRDQLLEWFQYVGTKTKISFRIWIAEKVEDLTTALECRLMADLTFRIVLLATTRYGDTSSHVYLSLAGGRKTMSADMQQAAYIFGCQALLHIAAPGKLSFPFDGVDPSALIDAAPSEQASQISPILISGKLESAPFLYLDPELSFERYPVAIPELNEMISVPVSDILFAKIHQRQQNARDLLFNFRTRLSKTPNQNFLPLYTCNPNIIRNLTSYHIGADPLLRHEDLAWIRLLPKAELHCHLGGILNPEEHIEVAEVLKNEVDTARTLNHHFDKWLHNIRAFVIDQDIDAIEKEVPALKQIRYKFDLVEPLSVCGFLQQFEGFPHVLRSLMYRGLPLNLNFSGIGIERFEQLGDLQGSGMLQSEKTLRKTLAILKRHCANHNVTYLELRCSPCNYTRGHMSSRQVVNAIIDELSRNQQTQFKIIFIASRHGKEEVIREHIQLYQELESEPEFRQIFVGFDVAGNEEFGNPKSLRPYFLPILEDCINMTIHAGESRPAASIWEAVYHLNADRVGHGLTLIEHPDLMDKFLNKSISIEMCPTSNFQIVGFYDFILRAGPKSSYYPLKRYLDDGLQVTINSDDPGMCLTDLTQEYYKAASMTKGGLSKWDILQIVKNGFESAFCSFPERMKMINNVGEQVHSILMDGL